MTPSASLDALRSIAASLCAVRLSEVLRGLMFALSLSLFLLATSAPVCLAEEAQQDIEKVEQMKKSAVELMRKGDYRAAIPILEKVLTINPLDKAATRYLVLARRQLVEPICKEADDAYRTGRYEKAINQWERILGLNPEDARAERLIEIGKSLIQDNFLVTQYKLAEQLMKEGNFEQAVVELQKILEVMPDEERARELMATSKQAIINAKVKDHYERAEKFMGEKKYDLAIEEWRSILELDKKQEEASRKIAAALRTKLNDMYTQAKDLYEGGNYVEAREVYYRIKTENPTDQDVKRLIERLDAVITIVQKLDGKGLVWDMLRKAMRNHIALDRNVRAAIIASWYATQLEPDNELAQVIRNFLEHEHTGVALSMEPPVRDMNIIDQYLFAALNHIYEGRYDLAVQESSIILQLQPENVLAWKRLGSAYFALGKKDKAREAWQQALKLAPKDKELEEFIKASD